MKYSLDRERLEAVQGRLERVPVERKRASERADENGSTRSYYKGLTRVSQELVEETRERYPWCLCENLAAMTEGHRTELPSLEAGIPASGLVELEAGCCGTNARPHMKAGYVCPRLDMVRRRCGV